MNVLPLVLMLLLTLSVLGLKQIERFKNTMTVQREYYRFLKEKEGEALSLRQKQLCDSDSYSKTRKFNFVAFINKTKRSQMQNKFEDTKKIFKDLMRVLYGETEFFKRIEQKQSDFLDEIIKGIVELSDGEDKFYKGRIENLAKIKFADPEIQEAFYQMLKGTISSEENRESYALLGAEYKAKSYKSLLDFLRPQGSAGAGNEPEAIPVYQSPPELLLALFPNPDVVKQIIEKCEELEREKGNAAEKKAKLQTFMEDFDSYRNANVPKNFLKYDTPTPKEDDHADTK